MLGDLTMARRHGHAPLPPDSSFPRRPSHESFGKGHAPAQGLLATLLATVKGVLQTTVCTIRRPKESCSSLRRFYKQFKGGATRLWADGRVAWRHRKLDEQDRCRLLDWRTARIARRAPWEVLHVLWLVFNPMPPPLGFFCIAAAYRWPRMLLSPQFHEPEQKARFARDDDRKRAEARAMLRGGQLASALVAASLCVRRRSRVAGAVPRAARVESLRRARPRRVTHARGPGAAVLSLLCFEFSEARREGGGAAGGRPVAAARVTLAQVRGAPRVRRRAGLGGGRGGRRGAADGAGAGGST